jgi:hypothetical protein
MRRGIAFLAVALVAVAFVGQARADEINITVSPNVINVASSSTVVTVHTDIPYSLVEGSSVILSVTVNEVVIDWWKSDNKGYFVAKFVAGDVKDVVESGTTATLTLSGVTNLGEEFSGSDDVDIIDVKEKGAK